jgi:hypothetical protein
MYVPDAIGKLAVYAYHRDVKQENEEIHDYIDRQAGDDPEVRLPGDQYLIVPEFVEIVQHAIDQQEVGFACQEVAAEVGRIEKPVNQRKIE